MPDVVDHAVPMPTETTVPRIAPDDFARRFSLRARNLMWFLGAGASASAGLPTAIDMIWEFKQQLFVSQRRGSLQAVSDLSHPIVRARLQAHVDSLGLPPSGAPDEYAALFEAVYPAESDRRKFLDAKLAGAKPSYGHMALAVLMLARMTRVVWTTNFDALIADALRPYLSHHQRFDDGCTRCSRFGRTNDFQRTLACRDQASRRFSLPPTKEHRRRIATPGRPPSPDIG